MNPVGSVTSNPSTALTLMQVDTSLKPRSGQEDAETDPTTLAATTALQVLDPRSALTLSTETADALLSLVHKHPRRKGTMDGPGGIIDESALLTDEAFAKTLENTPARYAAAMKGLGASRWVWRPEVHPTGINFFKAMSLAIPRDFGKTNSMAQAIFNDKTAKILDKSDAPDANLLSGYYDMYNDNNDSIGTVRRTECDPTYLENFKKANPGLLIAPIYFGNDAVLIVWPDASDREIALSSLQHLKLTKV